MIYCILLWIVSICFSFIRIVHTVQCAHMQHKYRFMITKNTYTKQRNAMANGGGGEYLACNTQQIQFVVCRTEKARFVVRSIRVESVFGSTLSHFQLNSKFRLLSFGFVHDLKAKVPTSSFNVSTSIHSEVKSLLNRLNDLPASNRVFVRLIVCFIFVVAYSVVVLQTQFEWTYSILLWRIAIRRFRSIETRLTSKKIAKIVSNK